MEARVGADAIEAAINALRAALGSDAVIADRDQLNEFRDPFYVLGDDSHDVSAAVFPVSVEEVQSVVRIANEHKVPLWTVSQGRNYGYGGAAPRVKGSILVNLSKMNRILEINEELGYAVVEPGVRWFDLVDALEAAGGKWWSSIPDLGWGSVIGNSLEYGRGHTRFGSHGHNIAGMEVVLPNGEVMRTGMGAMTGNKAWHAYPFSYGPTVDGLFMQSSMGIVTRIGWRLMPRPEKYASCWVHFDGDEIIVPVIDAMRELQLDETINNYPFLGRGVSANAEGQPDLDPNSQKWALRFALYGYEEIVEAKWRIVERVLGSIPGVEIGRKVYDGTDRVGPDKGIHDDRVQAGIPGMELLDLYKVPFGPDTGHLDFSPIGPLIGSEVLKMVRQVQKLYDEFGEPYAAGCMLLPTSIIVVSVMFFDPKDKEKTLRMFENFDPMLAKMKSEGYGLYRTGIYKMDAVADTFDFNDHALRRFVETIKDAVDPNGVLQPGKQGIWPQAYRG
ncbi:FAD-binding oxidoreductase [Microbacterium timonense]|uniref:FAD-binding oxidoreductase n=1 Tax=Microbacterium timonense TaxID=2086576 RepID=UPI00135C3BE2|nr:FAD-binding oxidoreductase [Microbacterium timonense]